VKRATDPSRLAARFASTETFRRTAFLLGPVLAAVLLGVEMLIALLTVAPAAKTAEGVGLKPVVAVGFAVYATFPVLLIHGPAALAPTLPFSAATSGSS
jgi:hypothetical protein